jgi:tRNA-dihydrouridine synthase B
VSVKIRAGWDEGSITAVDAARIIEAEGGQWITVHPRTRKQGFSGAARWEIIQAVKQAVRIPVIGNGDILTPEDAVRMVRETGCDAVMVGRAASSNPWIFRQIADYLATGRYEHPPEIARYEIMRRYYVMLAEHRTDPKKGVEDAVGKMKQFATYFTHGVRNGAKLRADIYHAHDIAKILSLVDEFFERELAAPAA